MHDRPTAAELVDAVRQYLEGELLPQLTDPRLRFQTLIAAHVLGIVARELPVEEGQLADEYGILARLLTLPAATSRQLSDLRAAVRSGNEALCQRIRAGEYDAPGAQRDLVALLREQVVRKLEVANPKYPR